MALKFLWEHGISLRRTFKGGDCTVIGCAGCVAHSKPRERHNGETRKELQLLLLSLTKLYLKECCYYVSDLERRLKKNRTSEYYKRKDKTHDTWRKDVKPHGIEDAINGVAPGRVRAVSVSEVSRAFHPNFSAKWRHYLHIFPLNDGENPNDCNVMVDDEDSRSINIGRNGLKEMEDFEHLHIVDKDSEDGQKQGKFDIGKVNQFLQPLEGKLLSYKMFARDTKASRNTIMEKEEEYCVVSLLLTAFCARWFGSLWQPQ